MLLDQQLINALLPLRDSFLTSLKKQLERENVKNWDNYGEVLGTYPDHATINQCWNEFLEKVTVHQRRQATLNLQTNGNTPDIWWVHCHFGLFLYHFAEGQLPLATVIRVLVHELETETGIKLSKDTVDNFWYVVQPDDPSNWERDFDSRARFLYKNIIKKLQECGLR